MKKSNKGFTLVELIVVIAIIGILAAILVPALVGYIRDSKLSSANSSAKTVYTAINNYCQKSLAKGNPAGTTTVGWTTVSTTGVELEPSQYDGKQFAAAVGASLNADAKGSQFTAEIVKNFPVAVAWKKNGADTYVGTYPEQAEKENAKITSSGKTTY